MNLISFLKEKKNYHFLYCLGIVMIPLIEIYRSFWGDTVQIAGIALEEALILLWAGALFLAGAVFALREKRKIALFAVGAYLLLFFAYLVFHAANAAAFDESLLPGASPNFVVECYYTVRMYLVPICLIFAAALLSLPAKRLISSLCAVAWIVSLSVILTDLLGVSFASYANGNVTVAGGFFSWFSLPENADFALYTAKGPFSSANDMGAILFALTPLVALNSLQKGRWFDHLLLFFVGVAAIMIGTKIASLGFFLALLGAGAVFLCEILFKKRPVKALLKAIAPLVILLLCIPLLQISPGYQLQNRREEEEAVQRPTENVEEILENIGENSNSLSQEDLLQLDEYLQEHYWDHFIDPWFLELYPVSYDGEFWNEIVSRPNHLNSDSRAFKIDLAQRITQRNQRAADALLGIGYTAGLPYAEKDYVFQYYQFGALGLIVLILPFFALCLWHALSLLRRFFSQKKPVLSQAAALVSLGAFLVTGYLAGHVFDTIICMYFLSFTCATLIAGRGDEGE